MQETEIELQIGDTVRLGEYLVTVVDIDGEDVSVRFDPADDIGDVHLTNGVVTISR